MLKKFWSVDCIPRKDKTRKKTEVAFTVSKTYKANYLFMGYTGRKGPKQYLFFILTINIIRDSTVMGSTLKSTMLNISCPIVIVKHYYERSPEDHKGFKFLLCLDGSK